MNISKNVNSSMAHFKSICFFANFSIKNKTDNRTKVSVFFIVYVSTKASKKLSFTIISAQASATLKIVVLNVV